ncbi:MAG TPA: 2-oxoacid:acceptor oxidoreductase family protein [Thermotogota bacterium]|nr:2-oxoacid:acceptor oxidoreductase family protein [Thermotogota bacterium]HRW35100.1 2-oxoacid:acceptor oxidoreductase family protein [Thermotogota bacterium]
MNQFDIYLSGVGGQGIGLLSELIARAIDHSGQRVIGADTHGLAQRGGMVASHIRMGQTVHSALVGKNRADLCVSLERHEALRAMNDYLKDGATLVYYDAVWQPLDVRMGTTKQIENVLISDEASRRGITAIRVFEEGLQEARMQNIVVSAVICKNSFIPGVNQKHFLSAMDDLMRGEMLVDNQRLFRSIVEKEQK